MQKNRGSKRSPEDSLNIAEENQQLRKRIKALEKENKRLSEMNEFLEDTATFFAAARQKSGKNKDRCILRSEQITVACSCYALWRMKILLTAFRACGVKRIPSEKTALRNACIATLRACLLFCSYRVLANFNMRHNHNINSCGTESECIIRLQFHGIITFLYLSKHR